MNKKIVYTSILLGLITINSYAQEKNYKGICAEVSSNICKDNKCNESDLNKLQSFNNFCIELSNKDNFLNKVLINIDKFEKRIYSGENLEKIKADYPILKEEMDLAEKRLIDENVLLDKYLTKNIDLMNQIENKTAMFSKERDLSNHKSFLIYVMKDNNLASYREFFNKKIKKENGENSISDFKNTILSKKDCVNLVFHTLQSYKLNEGIAGIKEVTGLLNEQNIKCK